MVNQGNRLNAGLIIAAVLAFVAGLLEICSRCLIYLDLFEYGFSFSAFFHFVTGILLSCYAIIFGFYILFGYKNNKKALGIIALGLYGLCQAYWFIDQAKWVLENISYSENLEYYDYLWLFEYFTHIICSVFFIVMLIKRNKIGLIIFSILAVVVAFLSEIPILIINTPLYEYDRTVLFTDIFDLVAYVLLYVPLVIFAVSAFSNNTVYVPQMPYYQQQPMYPVPPVYGQMPVQPQPVYSAPQYTQPQPVPAANAVEDIAVQLEKLKQKHDAGEISEETYSILKKQLLEKVR